jgi:ribosomal protein L7/L12
VQPETIVAGVVGIVIGYVLGRLSKRDKARIVWSEPIDFDKIDPEVKALTLGGQKIQAIKRYREIYKVDLKQAKEVIDALEDHP